MSLVLLEWLYEEQVAWIRLNDPQRLNAMGEAMALEFRQVLGRIARPGLRAVLLSGEGASFSAGGDLAMLEARQHNSVETNQREMLDFYRCFLDMVNLEVPLVAAVQGWAVGAGCCLVAACDLRLADPAARFRVPFLQMGLFPGMGSSHWFPLRMGPWASEFLLTGMTLDAPQAAQRGLITGVSQSGQVLEAARAQLEKLLQNGAECTRDLLKLVRGPREQLPLALEREAQRQALSYAREEFARGLARVAARSS